MSDYLKAHYPNHGYSFKNDTKMGPKCYYHCCLSKQDAILHCRNTVMIFYLSETKIIIHENEEEHTYHNKTVNEGIGEAEKKFFEFSFDNGTCTAGGLIRLLRKHKESEKKKDMEFVTLKEPTTRKLYNFL